MKIVFFILIFLGINAYSNVLPGSIKTVAKSNKIILSKPLINITKQDLLLNSKNDNIQNLFERALNENRINYLQYNNIRLYNNLEKGDELLLKCLKLINCNIQNFAENMQKSELHKHIAYNFPSISTVKLNKAVGNINENLMNKFFTSSKWTKIQGEIGNNGIDGLFVKKDSSGIIKDVLIVESKYNKSDLKGTNNGKQMTKQWISKKIEDLKNKYPENNDYVQIENYVNNGVYRAMLWNLKIENETLIFDLSKLNDKNGNIEKINLVGGEKFKINHSNNSYINMNNPENDFQKQIINWYKEELNSINLN